MPAYNFQAQFAPLVESGKKTQTIRQTDKNAKPGDTAFLYTGQRTKACRKLGEGIITEVIPIQIWKNELGHPFVGVEWGGDPMWLVPYDVGSFARSDGFPTIGKFIEFFETRYGLPFRGFLHKWTIEP